MWALSGPAHGSRRPEEATLLHCRLSVLAACLLQQVVLGHGVVSRGVSARTGTTLVHPALGGAELVVVPFVGHPTIAPVQYGLNHLGFHHTDSQLEWCAGSIVELICDGWNATTLAGGAGIFRRRGSVSPSYKPRGTYIRRSGRTLAGSLTSSVSGVPPGAGMHTVSVSFFATVIG